MPRTIRDGALSVTAAMPNAANTVNTNALDLGSVAPYPVTEVVNCQLTTTAATGANGKKLSFAIQDSADGANWANVAGLGAPVCQVQEANGNYAAVTQNIALPAGVRRYVRGSAAGEANGGDASGGRFTVSLLF